MTDLQKRMEKIALKMPEVYLPADKSAMKEWAVVACDQYTSDTDYWESVKEITKGKPSTLNLIYPECYLTESEPEKRIAKINETMKEYLSHGVLEKNGPAFYLVKRQNGKNGSFRYGLVAALDLEAYDYSKESKSLIRATEGTIEDRIPPRKRIRKDALLELPHILVLIDDPEKTVIEPLAERRGTFEKVYDFDLMKDGGHIEGYRIDDPDAVESIVAAIEKLADRESFRKKYGTSDVLLYAMGDGNHSLATAKSIWEEIKKNNPSDPDIMNHPARWALVEIENIHDDGIVFEPIHRVLFNCGEDLFLDELKKTSPVETEEKESLDEVITAIEDQESSQKIGLCSESGFKVINILKPSATITAGTVQKVIDSILERNSGVSVDYIHGNEETAKLGRQKGNIGIFLPAIDKHSFFQTIVKDKTFPRKTFSMGEANEKRYYIECRKITK